MSLAPLHLEALSPGAQVLLAQLAQRSWSGEFYLAGSAALALYLGHRPVPELDLMTAANRLTSQERRDLLADLLALDLATEVETARDGYLFARLGGGVGVRFFHYPYPLVDGCAELGGMAVASAADLGLMKLGAIISRGSRRDFVDLYLLCRLLPLPALLDRAGEKFGHVRDFPLQALKGLADWSELECEPMPRLALPLQWSEVEQWLRETVRALGRGRVGLAVEPEPAAEGRREGDRRPPSAGTTESAPDAPRVEPPTTNDRILLVENLAEVATPLGTTPRRGGEQRQVRRIPGAEVVCRDGQIAFVGSAEERRRLFGELPSAARLDGRRGTLVPGFVDPHTHLPWAGSREGEFAARLAGKSYQEIAAAGGGILATVAATRQATEEELTAAVGRRLDQMLAWGTTTAEAKSGYGLALAPERKQLRAIQRAAERHPVDLVPTLLAAHEVPPELRHDRARYVDLVCEEIIPAVAGEGLARFCDVFCEAGVFSAEESRRVLVAGARHGLLPRLHADEFADSGGALLAAELGALSADHLLAVGEEGIAALARAGVTAVLLPGTSFFLMRHGYAPARRLIAAGVPVALGTDCNPGSSYTESMPMVLVLAVFELGLSIEEALTAATLNAACSLGLGAELGSIEPGKRADLVLLDAPNLLHLAYHFGINPVAAVVKDGAVVRQAP